MEGTMTYWHKELQLHPNTGVNLMNRNKIEILSDNDYDSNPGD